MLSRLLLSEPLMHRLRSDKVRSDWKLADEKILITLVIVNALLLPGVADRGIRGVIVF
jgi:hypothetical protein